MKQSNALLNSDGTDVVCQECGKEISGVSEAMKRTLKSFGQVIRTEQRQAFMLACKACNANRQVVVDQNNKTLCKVCHGPMVVHAAFRLAMENAGNKLDRVDTSETKEADSKPKATKKKVTRKKKTTKKAE